MQNPAVERFETTLATLLNEIDRALEDRYAGTHALHPARPVANQTANPQYDGLFTVLANFTAGFGSKLGPGYTLVVRISTLENVSPVLQASCESFMVDTLRARLPGAFPGRHLAIDRDVNGWKLYGDLSIT